MLRYCVFLTAVACLFPLLAATTMPADSFTAGSRWTGTEIGDPRRPRAPQAKSRGANLTLTDRKDQAFEADYAVGSDAIHLKGKVDNHGMIMARAVNVIHGNGWGPQILDIPWTGQVSDTRLVLSYTQSNNLEQTIQLSLVASDETGKKSRKKSK